MGVIISKLLELVGWDILENQAAENPTFNSSVFLLLLRRKDNKHYFVA